MVAAQWGESREPDARTGGVAGRFRLLGGSGEASGRAPDAAPQEFGTAPWGYRRSEVDAWASWVAGLIAHGRNETARADSAEATLRATLERLQQLEEVVPLAPHTADRDPAGTGDDEPGGTADGQPRSTADVEPAGTGDDKPGGTADDEGAGTGDDDPGGGTPAPGGPATDGPGAGPRTDGRPRFDPSTDLPRRTARGGAAAAERAKPADHDLARLHVVETTLHEVMVLLNRLAGPERPPSDS